MTKKWSPVDDFDPWRFWPAAQRPVTETAAEQWIAAAAAARARMVYEVDEEAEFMRSWTMNARGGIGARVKLDGVVLVEVAIDKIGERDAALNLALGRLRALGWQPDWTAQQLRDKVGADRAGLAR